MSKQVNIFLADDHVVVRTGLKELIERMGPYKVQRQFNNGKEVIDALPFDLAPDLLILDLNMPVMDGMQTVAELTARNVEQPVLILTIDTSEKTIIELYKMGVRGYLPKNCTADAFKKAIESITETGYYHSELLIKALQANTTDAKEEQRQKILKQITERERIFLQLVCNEEEYTYEQMADILKVHRRTIDGYRESLFDKFSIKSKTGLVLFAIKYGLVDMYAGN